MNVSDIQVVISTEDDQSEKSFSAWQSEMNHQMKLAREKYGPQTRSLIDRPMSKIHRAKKSTNVSIATEDMRQEEREYESSEESYVDEKIVDVIEITGDTNETSLSANNKDFQETTNLKIQAGGASLTQNKTCSSSEDEIKRIDETPKAKGKKARSEGAVRDKFKRVDRILVALKLRKRATVSANPILGDQGTSQTQKADTLLIGAETPLQKKGEIKHEKIELPVYVTTTHTGFRERITSLFCCGRGVERE